MGEATRPGVQTDKLFQERRHGHQPQEPKLLWIVREAIETLVPGRTGVWRKQRGRRWRWGEVTQDVFGRHRKTLIGPAYEWAYQKLGHGEAEYNLRAVFGLFQSRNLGVKRRGLLLVTPIRVVCFCVPRDACNLTSAWPYYVYANRTSTSSSASSC